VDVKGCGTGHGLGHIEAVVALFAGAREIEVGGAGAGINGYGQYYGGIVVHVVECGEAIPPVSLNVRLRKSRTQGSAFEVMACMFR
jgi:hypothetical protein